MKIALPAFTACMLAALALGLPAQSRADEIRVATASNFRDAMEALSGLFGQQSGHRVVPVYGSTGKHYAQIINGAPFDAFFAADARRPERLERDGIGVAGSRFTYAIGVLVLWSPRAGYVDADGDILRQGQFRRLAIANPELAPYGAAARDVLQSLGLWQAIQPRLVFGENIGQAFLFVSSGNAALGFVAGSQLASNPSLPTGSLWRVPASLHRPIEQQAVLITDTAASRAFMAFIRGPEAARIIREHGYSIPRSSFP